MNLELKQMKRKSSYLIFTDLNGNVHTTERYEGWYIPFDASSHAGIYAVYGYNNTTINGVTRMKPTLISYITAAEQKRLTRKIME